jgi:putative membrane protein
MSISDLPAVNASLNALSAVLLGTGYAFIRRGRWEAHRICMLAALTSSTVFLAFYLVYHYHVGSVRFTGQGPLRTLYFAILISHTILAVVIVPLVATTAIRALRQRFDAHRRIARVTLPLWAYVSVTGVVIYWMLYRL